MPHALPLFTLLLIIGGCVRSPGPSAEQSTRRQTIDVEAGALHTCALHRDGSVSCWGAGDHGQLGLGDPRDRLRPRAIRGLSGVTRLALGASHSCALSRGEVRCWGRNDAGQLGDGTRRSRLHPTTVLGLTDAVSLTAGYAHTCALRETGVVTCWGAGEEGQLGDGSAHSGRPRPAPVRELRDAVEITAGDFHTCALREGGVVTCWGRGDEGQLGAGARDDQLGPHPVSSLSATHLAAGGLDTCAIDAAGALLCWGHDAHADTPRPLQHTGWDDARALVGAAARGHHRCAINASGRLQCWGDNSARQLHDVPEPSSAQPIPRTLDAPLRDVACGALHTCALTERGLRCWGLGDRGQLGTGDTQSAATPKAVAW